MTTRPILTSGTLDLTHGEWTLKLSSADPAFENGMPVKLVLWDDRDHGEKSEVEQIAQVQQLDAAIVALALSAEGKLKR